MYDGVCLQNTKWFNSLKTQNSEIKQNRGGLFFKFSCLRGIVDERIV